MCIFLRIVHFFTCFCCCWIVDTCVCVYISWQKFFIQHSFLTRIKIVKIFPQLIFCFLILLMVVLSCRNTDFFCMDQKNWETPWKTETGWYQIRRNKIRENHSEKPEKSCFGGGNGSSTDPSSESMDLRNGGVVLGSTMRIFNLKQQGWWNPLSAPLVLSRGYQWHCPQDKAVPGHWGRRGRLMSRQQVTPRTDMKTSEQKICMQRPPPHPAPYSGRGERQGHTLIPRTCTSKTNMVHKPEEEKAVKSQEVPEENQYSKRE